MIRVLYYTEIALSPYEVPEHNSICIYISGCCNYCKNCHYSLLQKSNFGDKLLENFMKIIQEWMNIFDFVKLGSYQENCGGLNEKTTNQKLLQKNKNKYIDITYKFWK